MIPIGDDNSGRTISPIINYLLIAVNVLVFIFVQQMGTDQALIMSFSTVPQEILTNTDITSHGLGVTPIPVYGTILTSMFMHASFGHLAGNMLFLWIFGDNLENVMGHFRYLVFYLLCGVIASLSHVFMSAHNGTTLYVPSLGASGAISGVLGGYLMLFPMNRIRIFVIRSVVHVPAIITLGVWIALQVVSQLGALGDRANGEAGGVAYAAHIGGFVGGILMVRLFTRTKPAGY